MRYGALGIGFMAASLAGSSFGNAADLEAPYKAPTSSLYSWTGFYIGAHAGWENAKSLGFTNVAQPNGNNAVDTVGVTDQTIRGWLGGGQLGYNHQFQRAVLGFELSGSWNSVKRDSVGSVINPPPVAVVPMDVACYRNLPVRTFGGIDETTTTTYSCNAKQDWTVQAVTRLGYALGDGRFLPYIAAGVSFSHLKVANSGHLTRVNKASGATVLEIQDTWGTDRLLIGAVAGGGVQYALGNGLSVGAEYLYTKYSNEDFSSTGVSSCSLPSGTCPGKFTAQENHDLASHTVRVVVNYKLGQ